MTQGWREGRDLTIVTWSAQRWTCLEAAGTLAAEGIEAQQCVRRVAGSAGGVEGTRFREVLLGGQVAALLQARARVGERRVAAERGDVAGGGLRGAAALLQLPSLLVSLGGARAGAQGAGEHQRQQRGACDDPRNPVAHGECSCV